MKADAAASPLQRAQVVAAYAAGAGLPVLQHHAPEIATGLIRAAGPALLAFALWRGDRPALRGAWPFAAFAALAAPGSFLAGWDAVAAWLGLLGLLCLGLAAWTLGDQVARWAPLVLRGAGVVCVMFLWADWVRTGRLWDVWYAELLPGERPWELSPLVWPPFGLALAAMALPFSAQALRDRRLTPLAIAEVAVLGGALLKLAGPAGAGAMAAMLLAWAILAGRLRRRYVAVGLVVVGAVAGAALALRSNLPEPVRRALSGRREAVEQRAHAYEQAGRLVSARPWTGHGVGRFAVAYAAQHTGNAETRYEAVARPSSPQCDALLAAAEVGVPAAVLLGLVALLALRRDGGRPEEWRVALIGALAHGLLTGCAFAPLSAGAMVVVLGVNFHPPQAAQTKPLLLGALGCMVLAMAIGVTPWAEMEAPIDYTHQPSVPPEMVMQAQEIIPAQPELAKAVLGRALTQFPAFRAAAEGNPRYDREALGALCDLHAQAAEMLAELREEAGDPEAAEALGALASQIRAAEPH